MKMVKTDNTIDSCSMYEYENISSYKNRKIDGNRYANIITRKQKIYFQVEIKILNRNTKLKNIPRYEKNHKIREYLY